MKKSIFFLLMLIICSFNALAQTANNSFTSSEVYKDPYSDSNLVFVKKDGNKGFYTVKKIDKSALKSDFGYSFEHYTKDFKVVKEEEFIQEYESYKKYRTLVGVVDNEISLHIIDIYYDLKNKDYVCTAHSAKKDDFTITHKELFRLSRKEADKWGKVSFKALFHNSNTVLQDDTDIAFVTSDLGKSFIIGLNLKGGKSKVFKFYSFDSNLNKKFDTVFEKNVKDTDFKLTNIDVNADGTAIYLLGAIRKRKLDLKKDSYAYELTKITSDERNSNGIHADNPFFGNLKTLVKDDKIICVGFYIKNNWYGGCSYFEFDTATLQLIKEQQSPFKADFIEEKYGDKKKKEQRNLKPLLFKNILITEDNDIIINAEEHYIVITRNNVPIYHYDDIISARLDEGGNMIWAKNINKVQATDDDTSFISYNTGYKDGTLTFYLNAGEEPKKLKDGRLEFRETLFIKNANLYAITIDSSGDLSYKILVDDDSDVSFMPSLGVQSGNSFFIFGKGGRKRQIIKVSL